MHQSVSSWPLIAEALFRSKASPLGICGRKSGTGTGFPPNISASPVNIFTLMFLSHSFTDRRQYATLAINSVVR